MRKNKLALTLEQKLNFERKLTELCQEFGVTIKADSYLEAEYIGVVDKKGNWNILNVSNDGEATIEDKDFWED